MIDCKFTIKINDKYKCERCGLVVANPNAIANCINEEDLAAQNLKTSTGPTLIQKTTNFLKAAVNHALVGNPTVTEEQLKRRLEICKSCVLFKPMADGVGGTCLHNSCGCNIQDTLDYMNKIAWADQECPVGKWGKEST